MRQEPFTVRAVANCGGAEEKARRLCRGKEHERNKNEAFLVVGSRFSLESARSDRVAASLDHRLPPIRLTHAVSLCHLFTPIAFAFRSLYKPGHHTMQHDTVGQPWSPRDGASVQLGRLSL